MGKWDIDRNLNQNKRCLKVYMEMYDLLIQEKNQLEGSVEHKGCERIKK